MTNDLRKEINAALKACDAEQAVQAIEAAAKETL